MVDPIKGLEKILVEVVEKGGKKGGVQGVVLLIEKIGLPLLAAVKGELAAVLRPKPAPHQKLGKGMEETVGGPLGDSEEKSFEGAEATALTRLVGSINNM